MKTIYYISGLGADEKAFSRLHLPGYQLVHLPWMLPLKKESIQQYASRMAQAITDPAPIVVGMSFGGMMSLEIAKVKPIHTAILISSIKTKKELPAWLKMVGFSKLNRVVPLRSYGFLEPIQNYMLGVKDEEERAIANNYRKNIPPAYLQWAVNEIVNWQNETIPTNVFHLHGDADHMFPIKYCTPTHLIKGGGHFMVMNKAAEVSKCLQEILQKA